MPASRIAFAIADLMSEIKSLVPRDHEVDVELRLSTESYAKVKAEVEHHYNHKITVTKFLYPNEYGEWFKFGGLRISMIYDEVDA